MKFWMGAWLVCLLVMPDAYAGASSKKCDPSAHSSYQKRVLVCLKERAKSHHAQKSAPIELAEKLYGKCRIERQVMHDAIYRDCTKHTARMIIPGYDRANIRTLAGYIISERKK